MALVCAPRSRAGASKFSFSKNSRGLKYQYFCVKIGLKLIFTIKNRRKHTNLKLSLKTILFWPPKSMILVFEETPPKKKNSSCFGFYSALKSIDTQMFFWLVFLKTHKKVIDCQKRHFGRFWRLITFFCEFSKILIKRTKIWRQNLFTVFISKLKNALFWGSTNFCS